MKDAAKNKIRVLVADDAALMRRIIGDIIQSEEDLELVGTAFNGEDALGKIKLYKPDVVTLDLEMPKLDGISTLQRIMSEDPIPVIVISSYTQQGSDKTMEALSCGAVDFVAKPLSGRREETLGKLREVLPEKIRTASVARLQILQKRERPKVDKAVSEPKLFPQKESGFIVAIGASTGGPRALDEILRSLPADIPAGVLITQHMPAGFTASLAERLNRISPLTVREAKNGDVVLDGVALIAPGGYHLKVVNKKIVLDEGVKVNHVRPAVDVMIESMAGSSYGIVAVILTGMGKDGVSGVKALKAKNKETVVLVQDPQTAVVKGMPEAVIKAGFSDFVVPLSDVSKEVLACLQRINNM